MCRGAVEGRAGGELLAGWQADWLSGGLVCVRWAPIYRGMRQDSGRCAVVRSACSGAGC
jgi:hypothetical protein